MRMFTSTLDSNRIEVTVTDTLANRLAELFRDVNIETVWTEELPKKEDKSTISYDLLL